MDNKIEDKSWFEIVDDTVEIVMTPENSSHPPSSILDGVKKMLGIPNDYDAFDTDVIFNINSAFFILYQLGVGPKNGYSISGSTDVWEDFSSDSLIVSATEQYLYLKTKIIFDPPLANAVATQYSSAINELEWRLREMSSGVFNEDDIEKPDDNTIIEGSGGE